MSEILSTISVVITCYSEGELLRDAIESILSQTVSPLEILLVNDASPDQLTNEICQEFANNTVQLIRHEQNRGTAAARNTGIAAAHGDIIVPLDADDLLPLDAIENIQLAFSKSPNIEFVNGQYWLEMKQGQKKLKPVSQVSLSHLLRSKRFRVSTNWNFLCTAPIRKLTWEKAGKYDENFNNQDLHDVDFWIRVLRSNPQYSLINKPIYTWRKYLGSNSRKVTPVAWSNVAEKHFDIYSEHGLAYRAYELLLLGSKWTQNTDDIKKYSNFLWVEMTNSSLHLSSIMTLIIPTSFTLFLGNIIQRKR